MDGMEFTKKMAEYNVGLKPTETFDVDEEFFDTI